MLKEAKDKANYISFKGNMQPGESEKCVYFSKVLHPLWRKRPLVPLQYSGPAQADACASKKKQGAPGKDQPAAG
jgi:hypothetical protein